MSVNESASGETRTPEQERLDAEVAVELMGFRWVEWNKHALAGSPLYEPGRFLAMRDDVSAHMQMSARPDQPLHAQSLARVPWYSSDLTGAFAAAETAALFMEGKAVLSQTSDARWLVEARGLRLASEDLPELLCRASLVWASTGGIE